MIELNPDRLRRAGANRIRNIGTQVEESHKIVTASLQKDRNMWVIRARVYDPGTGKTEHRSKSTRLSVKGYNKRMAEQIMEEVVQKWESGPVTRVVPSGEPLTEYARRWLKRKKTMRLKATTIKSYEDYLKDHIEPAFGNTPITALKLPDIEDFYADYLQNHTVNSARKVNCVLNGAFRQAIREGIIQVNLADNNHLEFPREKKFEGTAYTPEEIAALMAVVKAFGEPIHAAVTLAVLYGLRRSEVVGLRWRDIDFENATLTVSNTVVCNGEVWIEEEITKTPKSHRCIALYPSTIPYLQELKQEQLRSGIPLDKVCVWPNGDRLRPDFLTYKLKSLMKKNGLRVIRFHDLRHTAAAMAASVLSPQQVQGLLGHGDIGTTFGTYGHYMDRQRRETATAINAIIEEAGIML